MNLHMQKRFRVPIVFDSDDSDDSYYDYDSYEDSIDQSCKNNKSCKVVQPEIKLSPQKPCVPKPPVNNARMISPVRRRPILKPQTSSLNQRANSVTLENHQNIQNIQEQSHSQTIFNSQNSISSQIIHTDSSHFEIDHPEFVESHTYALVEKRNPNFFKKSRTFSFLDKGKTIHQVTLNSLSNGKIKLSDDIVMHIRNNRTEFVFKKNDAKATSILCISFSTPYSFEECKRKTTIRFSHATGGMLPHKIVSLPTANETVFDGHYFIKSKRNVAFAVINNSKPVLMSRQIKSNIMEVDTILNLSSEILFGISIALYIGKNKLPENDAVEEDKHKFQIFQLPKILNNI